MVETRLTSKNFMVPSTPEAVTTETEILKIACRFEAKIYDSFYQKPKAILSGKKVIELLSCGRALNLGISGYVTATSCDSLSYNNIKKQ